MKSYPHWCKDEHDIVGYSDSEHERCPVCRANDMSSYLQQENSVLHERVRKLEIALEKEREACAKVAENAAANISSVIKDDEDTLILGSGVAAAKKIAALIRGRREMRVYGNLANFLQRLTPKIASGSKWESPKMQNKSRRNRKNAMR